MIWIDAFKLGTEIHYKGRIIKVSQEMLDEAEQNFAMLSAKGYRFPFKREHGTVDSFQYGDLMATRQEDGYLSLGIEMRRDEEKTAFKQGIMREFSVGFDTGWIDPHTGENHGMVIYELSFTSEGYQKVLRDPTDINSGVALSASQFIEPGADTMARTKVELAAESAPLEETDAKLMEGEPTMADLLKAIVDGFASLKGEKEEPEELEMATDKEEEVAKLSARINQLEADKTRMELSAAGIKGDVVPSLVQLSRTDAKLYAATVKMLSSKPQPSIGTMGEVETTVHLSAADVAAEAVKAGKAGRGHLAIFLNENYPEFPINTVRAALK
jgi:hypothetical protein